MPGRSGDFPDTEPLNWRAGIWICFLCLKIYLSSMLVLPDENLWFHYTSSHWWVGKGVWDTVSLICHPLLERETLTHGLRPLLTISAAAQYGSSAGILIVVIKNGSVIYSNLGPRCQRIATLSCSGREDHRDQEYRLWSQAEVKSQPHRLVAVARDRFPPCGLVSSPMKWALQCAHLLRMHTANEQ